MKNYLIAILLSSFFMFSCSGEEDSPTENPGNEFDIPGYDLIWHDEFEGSSIDNSKWDHEVNATGGGNSELQYYTARPENSFVEDGELHIVALREEYTGDEGTRYYTSARMRTANKGDWKYGRIEVKAKIPYGQGLWPAIWMLPTDWEYGGWPSSGEIDIMEHVGWDQGNIHGSVHTEAYNHKVGTQKSKQIKIPSANSAFHIYAIEWSEDKIDFFVDTSKYFTFVNDKAGDYKTWPFDKEFHLLLNVAVGGDWPGDPSPETIFPKEMVVEYVRVYKKQE